MFSIMKYYSLFLFIILIGFASAQLGYNNPKLPRVQPPTSTTTTTSSSGGNVTSVNSGDGCILVSPTTGDVFLTLNTSCVTGGSVGNPFDQVLNRSSNVTFYSANITGYLDLADLADEPANPPTLIQRVYGFLFHGISQIKFKGDDGFITTLGRDNLIVVRNTAGFTLTKGQAVYITGATGNVANVNLSRADSETTMPTIGIIAENISNNGFGRVMIYGKLESIDTSAFSEGDVLYVSPTQYGNLTNVAPTAPDLRQRVGVILVSGVGNGAIQVDTDSVRFGDINNNNIPFSDGSRLTQDGNLTYNRTTRVLNSTYLAGDGSKITNITHNVFNSTYNNLLNQTCPSGQVVNGTLSNGTIKCQTVTATITAIAPYLNASGSTVQFNETKLNQTISNLGVRVGFNSTYNATYDAKISFNNTNIAYTNNSNIFTNKNTITQTGLGEWLNFSFTGVGALGQITSALGLFEFHALNGFDFYFTNTARTAIIALLNSGVISLTATNVNIPAIADFNSSKVSIYKETRISNNLNVSGNVCLDNGRCLNYTAGLKNSLPSYNNTLLYWDNDNKDWKQLVAPANGQIIKYCDSGGLQWITDGGACPI